MRSLEPMDRVICLPLGNLLYKINCCKSRCKCESPRDELASKGDIESSTQVSV